MVAFRCHISAIVLLAAAICCCGQAAKNYTGYTVYRCIPQTIEQVNELSAVAGSKSFQDLDFWTEPRGVNMSVDVMVAPKMQERFAQQLRRSGIRSDVMIQNVEKEIKRSRMTIPLRDFKFRNAFRVSKSHAFYLKYRTLDEIEERLKEISKHSNVEIKLIGESYEKRNLYLVKVSTNPKAKKPIVLIDAGHHAREWISHSTLLFLLESLVGKDMPCRPNGCQENLDALRKHLDKYDFWFVPMVNPDGYVRSYGIDRMWRKTVSKTSDPSCLGIDPNRNYDFHWSGTTDPCAQDYSGERASSESETKAMADVMSSKDVRIDMYISLHSYSQFILTPWAYTRKLSKYHEDLKAISKEGVTGMKKLRGTQYKAGAISQLLWVVKGSSIDYAHGSAKIPFALGIELPDTGKHGFLLPPSEIIHVGIETNDAVGSLVGAMRSTGAGETEEQQEQEEVHRHD